MTFAGSGRFYPAVLAAAAVTFIGALTRIRLLALGGWLSLCALVAYATVYSQQHLQTGSRFGSGAWTVGIDMVAAFAPLTVLGLLSAFALRGEPRLRDATWLSPAIALSALQSTWTPETGQPWAHLLLLCGLFAAPFLAACVWRGRVGMGAAALLGAVAAPEAVWLSTALGPGTIGALVMLCVLGLTAAACVVLLGRRAQRTHTEPASN